MPEFSAKEFHKLSPSEAELVDARLGPGARESKRNLKIIAIFQGKAAVGHIVFINQHLLDIAADDNVAFFREHGHTLGEELFRHFVHSRTRSAFYSTPLSGPGRRFLNKLAKRALLKFVEDADKLIDAM